MITIKEMLNCTWSGCGRGGGVDTLHSALSSTSNLLLVRCEDDFQTLPSLSSCNLLADSHGATIPGMRTYGMENVNEYYVGDGTVLWYDSYNLYY